MKNKKMILAVMIIFHSLYALSLHAGKNESVSTVEHEDKVAKRPSGGWLTINRNKLLLAAGIIAVLGGGAYILHTKSKAKKTDDGANDPSQQGGTNKHKGGPTGQQKPSDELQKGYTDLRKAIDTLTKEGTPYRQVYNAGIDILPPFPSEWNVNLNALVKLNQLKLLLSDRDAVTRCTLEKIAELGTAIADLEWPAPKGGLMIGAEIEKSALTPSTGKVTLDDLINKTLPAMATAAITKVEAALEGAKERSKEDQSSILLPNLYRWGTSITAHDAVAELKARLKEITCPPGEILQKSKILISRLADIANPKLPAFKQEYETTLQEYQNLTKKGSLYSDIRDIIGIDLFEQEVEINFDIEKTSAAYKKAAQELRCRIERFKPAEGTAATTTRETLILLQAVR
jgi:hypothetical protein